MRHCDRIISFALIVIGIVILVGHTVFGLRVVHRNKIWIIGTYSFVVQTQSALDFLSECSPDTFAEIPRYIHLVVEFSKSGISPRYKVFSASKKTAFAPGRSQPVQLFWYAGAIVHDARHGWQYHNGLNIKSWDEKTVAEREIFEKDAISTTIPVLQQCTRYVPQFAQHEIADMLEQMIAKQNTCDYCNISWMDRNW